MQTLKLLLFCSLTLGSASATAFKEGAFGLGVGYYSQNFLNKTAQADTGETKLLGEANYPLNIKYDFELTREWFWSPQLSYTVSPRKSPGDTSTMTLTHLSFLFGKNLGRMGSSWDWYFGPGLLQEDIKGKGGLQELPNGTGTATFALPGKTSTIRKVTSNLGGSWSYGRSRLGLDLILENAFSSTKRTQSLMFGYSYLFGSGRF